MKFALGSDIHLEFGQLDIKNTEKADVLILSGDILVADNLGRIDNTVNIVGEGTQSNRYHAFMKQACSEFPHVIYIMGNHEHYNGDFQQSANIIRDAFSYLPNLHFLEKETCKIDGVIFVCATAWTNMNDHDFYTMKSCDRGMNDYHVVRNGFNEHGRKILSPEDTYQDHLAAIDFIKKTCQENPDESIVVVTHHAPSKKSIHERYKRDHQMNGAYSSDLDYIMGEFPQIKIWTHGHTHFPFDYRINETRVICNPRGYIGYEHGADKFELKYFTLSGEEEI